MGNLKYLLVILFLTFTLLLGTNTIIYASSADTVNVALGNLGEETHLPWNGSGPRFSYLTPIYDFLVYSEPETGRLLPGLATRWEMSPDAKTWTFWLRQGVQFHENWGELTADDVLYTFERIFDPKSHSGPGRQFRAIVDKIEAPERYKVNFRLKTPLVDMPIAFLANNMQQPIVCKKYIETVGDEKADSHPIGTGPFTIVEHKRGLHVKLKAIENVKEHWRITPQFNNINFLIVPEESTRVAMMRAGEIDLAPISYDSVDTIKESGLKIITIKRSWSPGIKLGGIVEGNPERYNPNNPWADKRVRQALNYAIDKNSIVKNIFHGEASTTGASQILPEWIDIKPYPYDPVKAKELLTEAGYPNGFSINLKTFTQTPGAELPTIGQAVAMYWSGIGLNVKIIPTDYGTLRSEWRGGKATDYAWTLRGLPFPSPVTALSIEHIANASNASFVTKALEAMVNDITKEFDIKKRSEIVRKAGVYIHDEAGAVFLVYADEPYAASKRVEEWKTPPMGALNMEYIKLSK